LAKVFRDALMCRLDAKYPGYAFSTHAGYGTPAHRTAIATLGPAPIHRRSFRGVKEYWKERGSTAETPPTATAR